MPSPELVLARIRLLGDAYNRHDPVAMAALFSEDCAMVGPRGEVQGRPAVEAFFRSNFRAFPDVRAELVRVLTPRPGVACVELTFAGTHLGPLEIAPGQEVAPTGRPFTTQATAIAQFNPDGEIQRYESVSDNLALMEQLGLAPATTLAAGDLRGLIEKFFAAANSRDFDAQAALCTEDVLIQAPAVREARGRQVLRQIFQMYAAAFPDDRLQIHDILIQGTVAFATWTGRGTHKGPLGPIAPTGKTVELNGITVFEVGPGGEIAAVKVSFDRAAMLRQLGVIQ